MTQPPPTRTPRPTGERAYQRVVDALDQAIRSGDLKPGDRVISERELVTLHDVSRSSVREALRVLESMHLISSASGDRRGAVVLDPSTEPARNSLLLMTQSVGLSDLVQFRMVSDGAANLMAARHRTDANLVALERNMARMRESLPLGYETFGMMDLEFHGIIAEAGGNEILQLCGDTVRESILDLIRQTIVQADDGTAIMLQSIGHHRDVFDAIVDRDGARASRLAREQLYTYYAQYLDVTERRDLADFVHEVGGHVNG